MEAISQRARVGLPLVLGLAACAPGDDAPATDACVPGSELLVTLDVPVLDLKAAEAMLFFNTPDAVHRVPATGGAPELLFAKASDADPYPPFWIVDDRLVVGKGDALEVFSSLPAPSGATQMLPGAYSVSSSGRAHILLSDRDERTFIGKTDRVLGEPSDTVYFSVQLDADPGEVFHRTPDHEPDRTIVVHGSDLYVATDPCAEQPDCGEPVGDRLVRITVADGSSEEVPIGTPMRLELVGTDQTYLYLFGHPVPLDKSVDPGGLYRLPSEGGTPERLIEHEAPESLSYPRFVVRPNGGVLVSTPDRVLAVDETGIVSEPVTSECRLDALADDGTTIYLSVIDAEQRTQILAVPLPP